MITELVLPTLKIHTHTRLESSPNPLGKLFLFRNVSLQGFQPLKLN